MQQEQELSAQEQSVKTSLKSTKRKWSLDAMKVVEKELILAVVMGPTEFLEENLQKVAENDFYYSSHREIWNALKQAYALESKTDIVTWIKYLDRKYIPELTELYCYPISIEHVATVSDQLAFLRESRKGLSLKKIAASIACGEDIEDSKVRELENILKFSFTKSATVKTKEAVVGFIHTIADRKEGNNAGIDTGFTLLDEYLGGLAPASLTVLASRPAVGKSAMLLQLSNSIPELTRRKVAYISTDMNSTEVMSRFVQMRTGIKAKNMLRGKITDTEFAQMTESLGRVAMDKLLSIYEMIGCTRSELLSAMMELHAKGVEVFLIDQLTGIKLKGEKSWQEIGEVTKSLRDFGKKTGACIVLAHQLNRGTDKFRNNDFPTLSDLKGSGEIEQDASNVLFLHRFPASPETVLIIAKNRMGAREVINVEFLSKTISFKERGIWKP